MTETSTPTGASVPVVVEGKPLTAEAQPERAAFMNRLDTISAFNEQANDLATRIADSDLAYVDDNVANKRYITKIVEGELYTPLGTPVIQVRRIPFPADVALPGTHILRADGTFYSIPAGVRSLGDVVDPDSGEPLVGEIDKSRHKNRLEAAGLGDLKLKKDGTVEAMDEMTAPLNAAAEEKGNKKK